MWLIIEFYLFILQTFYLLSSLSFHLFLFFKWQKQSLFKFRDMSHLDISSWSGFTSGQVNSCSNGWKLFMCLCLCLCVSPEAPCSASEHPVTVSVLIGVEDTNIQLTLILMKLKWTVYKWSSTHVCMFLSFCTHMHGFAHVDLHVQHLHGCTYKDYYLSPCLRTLVSV